MIWRKFIFFTVVFSLFFCFTRVTVKADETDDKLKALQDEIAELQSKIADSRGKQQTLASTISYLNNKIQLTIAEISKTQAEIAILQDDITNLSKKIDRLDISLDLLSQVLASRIEETYKRMYVKPFYVLFSTNYSANALSRLEYLKNLQNNDKKVLYEMENTRENFNQQKNLKEQKQAEMELLETKLEEQQVSLGGQKKDKEYLLVQTKNDEANFQSMLKAAMAELEAIQSIIAGKGEESEAGSIKEGDKIATIISGKSACSTGTHLHFEVSNNGAHTNPAGYLKSISTSGDQLTYSGSWSWPINEPVTITQGYGMTDFARSGFYGGSPHTGIDMVSNDLSVKSVRSGTLYRGSIGCGGGTLRYVRVDHDDSDIDTYYLHVHYY